MTASYAGNECERDRLDFGYHWVWTYGHLIPAVGLTAAAVVSIAMGAPGWVGFSTGALALWAGAGFIVMRFVVRMNDLSRLPVATLAPGASRVLDLGCGAGRTSLMVALEHPESRVVGLDNFSAGYIDGHGQAKTRANLRAAGVEDRVEIRSGDMREVPFADASFDAVVSMTAVDHLERVDVCRTLAEANRVLRPDGKLLLFLIVPNLWTFIAFGPLLHLHGFGRSARKWSQMLGDAGFSVDSEGTTQGVAWVLAKRRAAPVPVETLDDARRFLIPRHALWLSGGLIASGAGLQLAGLNAPGLLLAGTGVVAAHLGVAFFGIAAFHGWLDRRRQRQAKN